MIRQIGPVALALLVLGGAAEARRSSRTRTHAAPASSWFEDGRVAYAKHDYEAALRYFQRGYAQRHAPVMLVNIAQCLRALGRNADAIDAFRKFLDSRVGSAHVRRDVFEALDELEAKARPPVAKVTLDQVSSEQFRRGRQKYARSDWDGALVDFRAAWRRSPSPALLVNIGQCLRKLDRPAEAVAVFSFYLEQGAGVRNVRADVWEMLDGLRTQLDSRMFKLAEAAALFQRWLASGQGNQARRAEVIVVEKQIRELLVVLDTQASSAPAL
jgi:tetratricopeptide (TPR) repeat protein